MKTPEECQCSLMSPCQWGHSGGYSCMWISFNSYLSIIYFIWCTATYTMRQTCVTSNITKNIKLRGVQHSPELVFRSYRLPCTRKPNFSSPVRTIHFNQSVQITQKPTDWKASKWCGHCHHACHTGIIQKQNEYKITNVCKIIAKFKNSPVQNNSNKACI